MYTSWKFHGKISMEPGQSYQKSFAQVLGVGDQAFEVDIEYCATDNGSEKVIYSVNGEKRVALWCNSKDFAEYNLKSQLVVFRPKAEVSLYAGSGFILPIGKRIFSVSEKYDGETVAGDPCGSGNSDCSNVVLKMHFHGANQVGQFSQKGKIVTSTIGGKEIARWAFKGNEIPSQITYVESSPVTGKVVATAEYILIGSTKVNEDLVTRGMIAEKAQLQVQRGRDIYGGMYDSKIADMQEHYLHQKQISDSMLNQRRSSSGSSTSGGILLIALGCAVILIGYFYIRKRSNSK